MIQAFWKKVLTTSYKSKQTLTTWANNFIPRYLLNKKCFLKNIFTKENLYQKNAYNENPNKMRNEKGDITTDNTEKNMKNHKRILRIIICQQIGQSLGWTSFYKPIAHQNWIKKK